MPPSDSFNIRDEREPLIWIPLPIFTQYRPVLGRTAIDVYTQLLTICNTSLTTITVDLFNDFAKSCDLDVPDLIRYLSLLRCASLVHFALQNDLWLISLIDVYDLDPQNLEANLYIDMPGDELIPMVLDRLQQQGAR